MLSDEREDVEKLGDELANSVELKAAFADAVKLAKASGHTWDVEAKHQAGAAVKGVYLIHYGLDPDSYVYVEGTRGVEIGTHSKLFGSQIFPDIAIKHPKRIAIELDHCGDREAPGGAKFRTTLAKAAFNVLSKDWDWCIELFYSPSQRNFNLGGENEKRILDVYGQQFHTLARIIT